ncbi:pyridoxal kinase PdxY [Shewanella sp. NIFS-20-20]|uniref:pyridoxal kinase PdxY n=1 Tax=Shewanella sp. NIFS-20-20 TaxID=2853806 RepID=UPI001C4909E0|nr:pyridoxal kinase PdxY [Shewanella sp. NIFS-20-20]MBV7315893.1 pyridoxal kinase PdxY [Shewanella sp. NIFS-20-20]
MKRILSIQSHVVFGCAGNSSAVFPMRRNGMEVWPINTVQFSNHTQYQQGFKGMVMPAGQITELVAGLANINALVECDALLSGYLGSAEQGEEILAAVAKIKQHNPAAIYFCDPVMGHPEKGCIVAPGVMEFFKQRALACADMIAPNLLELETLADCTIDNLAQAKAAARRLLDTGLRLVLVKHLSRAGSSDEFQMLLCCEHGDFLISRPLYEFERQPVGVGDLLSGLMLSNLLRGFDAVSAFERTNAAVDSVLKLTCDIQAYELQLIAAQDQIADPNIKYRAQPC